MRASQPSFIEPNHVPWLTAGMSLAALCAAWLAQYGFGLAPCHLCLWQRGAYWAAIATWLEKDRRLARLATAYVGAPVDLLPEGTEFQIQRRGEDERFKGSQLRVPKGTLRDRTDDVLSPEALVRRHAGYRNRVLMGPSFRADVWTTLEHAPDLSIADIARKASCSFATAWQTAQDYRLLRAAGMNAAKG